MVDRRARGVATDALLGLRRISHCRSPRISCGSMKKRRKAKRLRQRAVPLLREGAEVNHALSTRTSALALRTIKGRASALDDAFDGSVAGARLPFPAIDREALREIAELAIGAREVPQTRTAGGDRLGEHVVDGGNELLQAGERN